MNSPVCPLESDCCGSGCNPCVFDIYEDELKIWKKIVGCTAKKTSERLVPEDYAPFTILSITQECEDAIRINFGIPPTLDVAIAVGQHLILKCSDGFAPVVRQYSPICVQDNYFEVVIRIYSTGSMSQIIESVSVGQALDWRGPFGVFEYNRTDQSVLCMIVCGTGIAPMARIIEQILDDYHDETLIRLIYSCRSLKHACLRKEITEWSHNWNFTCHYYVTESSDEEIKLIKKYSEKVSVGRINKEIVADALIKDIRILVCGTKSFTSDVTQYLAELSFPMEKLFKF